MPPLKKNAQPPVFTVRALKKVPPARIERATPGLETVLYPTELGA